MQKSPTKETYILQRDRYLSSVLTILGDEEDKSAKYFLDLYVCSKEPCIPTKEPYIPSKEPYIPSKGPYIPSKEPSIPSEEPCIPSKEPYMPF